MKRKFSVEVTIGLEYSDGPWTVIQTSTFGIIGWNICQNFLGLLLLVLLVWSLLRLFLGGPLLWELLAVGTKTAVGTFLQKFLKNFNPMQFGLFWPQKMSAIFSLAFEEGFGIISKKMCLSFRWLLKRTLA